MVLPPSLASELQQLLTHSFPPPDTSHIYLEALDPHPQAFAQRCLQEVQQHYLEARARVVSAFFVPEVASAASAPGHPEGQAALELAQQTFGRVRDHLQQVVDRLASGLPSDQVGWGMQLRVGIFNLSADSVCATLRVSCTFVVPPHLA